jgi:hypothetical protein
MGIKRDLSGQWFGRLLVLAEAPATRKPNGASVRRWDCRCLCGNETTVRGESLTGGNTRSCGCLKTEVARLPNQATTKHGMVNSATYSSWAAMLSRCRHREGQQNKYHGGQGVTVCSEWDPQKGGSFLQFLADAGERPEGTSLDRYPNPSGNYEPGNVRWATKSQQANNMRSNVWVEYEGRRLTLAQAARASGIHQDTLGLRYRNGDLGDRLFRKPQHTGRRAWKS